MSKNYIKLNCNFGRLRKDVAYEYDVKGSTKEYFRTRRGYLVPNFCATIWCPSEKETEEYFDSQDDGIDWSQWIRPRAD